MEKISVIIPSYNHASYLKQATESIVNQTYPDLEIIIINDGAKDGTDTVALDLVSRYNNVSFIDMNQNMKKWYCLNYAIEKSNGSIITIQDADDVSLKNRIERQYNALVKANAEHVLTGIIPCYTEEDIEKNKDNIVSGDLNIVYQDEVFSCVKEGYENPGITYYYLRNYHYHGGSCMFTKKLFDKGLRFNPSGNRINCAEDGDFNTRATLSTGNSVFLNEPLYLHRRFTTTNFDHGM